MKHSLFGTTTLLVAISSFKVIVALDLRICDFLYNSLFFFIVSYLFLYSKKETVKRCCQGFEKSC